MIGFYTLPLILIEVRELTYSFMIRFFKAVSRVAYCYRYSVPRDELNSRADPSPLQQ